MRANCVVCGKNRVLHWAKKCSTCITRERFQLRCPDCGKPIEGKRVGLCAGCDYSAVMRGRTEDTPNA